MARELERRWEEALCHEQQLQEEYARFRRERPLELTLLEREAILRLALSITHNFCELVGAAHGAGSG